MTVESILVERLMKFAAFTGMWPPYFEKRRIRLWIWRAFWWVSFLNYASLLTFMPLHFYLNEPPIIEAVDPLITMSIVIQLVVNQIIWKWNEEPMLRCSHEILNYMKFSSSSDKRLIHDLYKRFKWPLRVLLFVAVISSGSGEVRFIVQGKLIFEAWYPFSSNESYLMMACIVVQQVTVCVQVLAGLIFDLIMCTFYLYQATRVRALSRKFRGTQGTVDLKQIVKEHQLIIEFSETSMTAAKSVLVKLNAVQVFISIFLGYFILQTTEGVQRTIFGTLFLIVNCKYYIYCWCSQQLLKACDELVLAAYECGWEGMSLSDRRMLLIIMIRAQKGLAVEIPGVIPPFSLEQFVAFANFSLSYVMTLRTFMAENA